MNTTGENMKRRTGRNVGLSLLLVLVVLLGSAAAQRKGAKRGGRAGLAPAPAPTLLAGQSSTLLPDGRWLVVGGIGASGPQARVAVGEAGGQPSKALSARLERPRGWHSATVLPAGSVLIFGGLDAGGVVDVAELFDPVAERV